MESLLLVPPPTKAGHLHNPAFLIPGPVSRPLFIYTESASNLGKERHPSILGSVPTALYHHLVSAFLENNNQVTPMPETCHYSNKKYRCYLYITKRYIHNNSQWGCLDVCRYSFSKPLCPTHALIMDLGINSSWQYESTESEELVSHTHLLPQEDILSQPFIMLTNSK